MTTLHNTSLLPYHTFGIDAKVRTIILCDETDHIPSIIHSLSTSPFIFGGGSNIVPLADYHGIVLRFANTHEGNISIDGNDVVVSAAMPLDEMVRRTIDNGLYGAENLSAIPGTIGGAIVQNAGAYGVEMKDIVHSVESVNLQTGLLITRSNAQCHFSYRSSIFKQHPNRELITRVVLRLKKVFSPVLTYKGISEALSQQGIMLPSASNMRDIIVNLRWSKLPRPEQYGSAGSFFKNPIIPLQQATSLAQQLPQLPIFPLRDSVDMVKIPAAFLIQQAGWKGRTIDSVGVWQQQPLVLYNSGHATAPQLQHLVSAIQSDIHTRFNISLEPEAIFLQ